MEAIAIVLVAVAVVALVLYRIIASVKKPQPVVTFRRAGQPGLHAPSLQLNLTNIMRTLISIAILAVSLYIILTERYQLDTQKWAFGAVGTVIGFWLKPG